VIVDNREKASGVPDILRNLGVMINYEALSVGDYIISPECGIERKSARDFVSSMFSGRVFDQASRLSKAYKFPVILVEGDFNIIMSELSKPRAVWGALATLSFGYNLHTFFTATPYQTADFIYILAKRERFIRPKDLMVKKKPKSGTIRETQLNVISMLPGIGPKLANNILTHFSTIRNVVNATVAELAMVRYVGRSKAERISKVLDAPYTSSAESNAQKSLDETKR